MGQAYILYVYDDAIRDAKDDPLKRYAIAVGKAVLTVCKDHWSRTESSAPVLNHSNAVNLAGEQHSTWQQVFLWSQNCLRSAADLSLDDLELARRLLDETIEERKASEKKE